MTMITNQLNSAAEYGYKVELSEEDRMMYNKSTSYINTCMTIFNDLSVIEKCKFGDPVINLSAVEYREMIAKENGWNEHLDVNVPFMKQIDETYNPNKLFERAMQFYNISRYRRELCANNTAKLDVIKNIVNKELADNRKVIVVSKTGEYAAAITAELNLDLDKPICGDFHDCIPEQPILDMFGNPVLIKSGAKKGQPKIGKSKYWSTENQSKFNQGSLKVLSIKSASDPSLQVSCNSIIMVTPLGDSIYKFMERFENLDFDLRNEKLNIHYLYCLDTIEEGKLLNWHRNLIYNDTNNVKNDVTYEESFDFI